MLRREFVATLAASAALAQRRKPNFLFILFDDAGPGDFGCYGQKHIQTPHVDRLAREGMLFSQAYAGAAVCAPSRASLMTGLHTGHAPVRANAGTIPLLASDVTLARHLQQAGYATGGFGKWGLGDAQSSGAPDQQGFDRFFGYLHQTHAHNYYPEYLWDCRIGGGQQKVPLQGAYSADRIAQESFSWLEQNAQRPFFCYATYTLPHGNFQVPDLGPYAAKDWPEKYKTYAAMVTRCDSYVGKLLEILQRQGVERDTYVVFASDNGGTTPEDHGFSFFETNGKLRDKKGSLYEGGIRTPMVVRRPGVVAPASRCDQPVAFCDYLPTFLDLAGLRAPACDGLSWAPALRGKKMAQRPYLYWEFNGYNIPQKRWNQAAFAQAVRMGQWKAVKPKAAAAIELYDLSRDPSETTDLAGKHPDLVARAAAYMQQAHSEPRPHDTGSARWL